MLWRKSLSLSILFYGTRYLFALSPHILIKSSRFYTFLFPRFLNILDFELKWVKRMKRVVIRKRTSLELTWERRDPVWRLLMMLEKRRQFQMIWVILVKIIYFFFKFRTKHNTFVDTLQPWWSAGRLRSDQRSVNRQKLGLWFEAIDRTSIQRWLRCQRSSWVVIWRCEGKRFRWKGVLRFPHSQCIVNFRERQWLK